VEPAPPADTTKASPDKGKAATPPETKPVPVKDEGYWRQQFADAHKKQADDAHELDILQREYNLKQMQYYSDPNVAMKQQFSRQDLTDTKTKIDEKTAAVEQDKQAISDLEDALRQAGGDAAWSR
jgi:chromosome segregation ATPase